MTAIKTNALSRRFGSVVAVDALDIDIETGEVYGFLGPNGAGKSTTINMLLGFTPPTSGSAQVLGLDIEQDSLAIRQRIGVLPEDFGVYNRLTARKHLSFALDTKGADDDPDELLARVGLADAADRKAGGFSTGMKQRLALAMALVGEPELLILDEPSSGLDPNGAREMRTIVREEVDRGATIFFSSHIMEQVEAICDRVGILRDGRLVAEDTISALKDGFDAESQLVVTTDGISDTLITEIEALSGISSVWSEGNDLVVSLTDDGVKSTVLRVAEDAGVSITDFETREPSLEDLFASLTTDTEATPS